MPTGYRYVEAGPRNFETVCAEIRLAGGVSTNEHEPIRDGCYRLVVVNYLRAVVCRTDSREGSKKAISDTIGGSQQLVFDVDKSVDLEWRP